MRTISQHHTSVIDNDFDYSYVSLVEGTSPMNLKRKSQFSEVISHLHNPNKLINDQMNEYYQKTKNSHFYVRDTRLGEASRELERKVTKLLRTNRQLNTINAYRNELEEKKVYYNFIKKEYPEIAFSEHDIHSYTIE